MESLALIAALIVLTTLAVGPIAVGFSFIKAKLWSRILTFIFAILAIFAGAWLFSLPIGSGARFMGLFSFSCGVWAIYRRRNS